MNGIQATLDMDGSVPSYTRACRGAFIFAVVACSNLLCAQSSPAATPTLKLQVALITFVDNKMSLFGGLPGQKSEAFRGKLFVGDELLATLTPGHFATFSFDPITVELTAQTWMATGPTGGAHVRLPLVAGKHYFVELRTKQGWPVTKMFGIKEITCEQARDEHEHDKPLDDSHIKSRGVHPSMAETRFPDCPKP